MPDQFPTTYLDAVLMMDSVRQYLETFGDPDAIAIVDRAIIAIEIDLETEQDSYAR